MSETFQILTTEALDEVVEALESTFPTGEESPARDLYREGDADESSYVGPITNEGFRLYKIGSAVVVNGTFAQSGKHVQIDATLTVVPLGYAVPSVIIGAIGYVIARTFGFVSSWLYSLPIVFFLGAQLKDRAALARCAEEAKLLFEKSIATAAQKRKQREASLTQGGWQCRVCQEIMEEQFTECWKCGRAN